MISELCAAERVPFTYVSSSAVYQNGSPPAKASCEESSVTYSQGRHPASIYGTSKGLGELICENSRRLHGLRCLIVRPFNLIGTRQSAAYGMVVPTFIRRALDGLPLQIHGDGTQVRCFSDVRQAVELLWRAITRTDWEGRVINLATDDHVTSVLPFAQLVQGVVGHPLEWGFVPHQSAYGENFVDVDYRRPNLESLRKLVGTWKHVSLEQTIREIVGFELVKQQLQGANLVMRAGTETESASIPYA
jgi:UDP-glucose 4-epimerase